MDAIDSAAKDVGTWGTPPAPSVAGFELEAAPGLAACKFAM